MKVKAEKSSNGELLHLSLSLEARRDSMVRAGLAGLYLVLSDLLEREVKPPRGLSFSIDGAAGVTLSFPAAKPELLVWIVDQAWQAKKGVLYCPAIHGSTGMNVHRVRFHNAMFATFLQHNRVQPRGKPEKRTFTIDEKTFEFSLLPVVEEQLIYRRDARNVIFKTKRGSWSPENTVELSGYVLPGSPRRFKSEKTWVGSARDAFLMSFAPIGCHFAEVEPRRGTWCILLPELDNLAEFAELRKNFSADVLRSYAASPADAALRYLVDMQVVKKYRLRSCVALVVGEVAWSRQQARRLALNVKREERMFAIFQRAQRCFPPTTRTAKESGNSYVSTAFCIARISENLLKGARWYSRFAEPIEWYRKKLEDMRKKAGKTEKGGSAERIWYERIAQFERKALIEFMEEPIVWQNDVEEWFVDAFHEGLRKLYGKESAAAKERQGSRDWKERIRDLRADIYRKLVHARTAAQVRAVLSEYWARADGVRTLGEHTGEIWAFLRNDWENARDLALVALASYKGKGADDGAAESEPDHEIDESGATEEIA